MDDVLRKALVLEDPDRFLAPKVQEVENVPPIETADSLMAKSS